MHPIHCQSHDSHCQQCPYATKAGSPAGRALAQLATPGATGASCTAHSCQLPPTSFLQRPLCSWLENGYNTQTYIQVQQPRRFRSCLESQGLLGSCPRLPFALLVCRHRLAYPCIRECPAPNPINAASAGDATHATQYSQIHTRQHTSWLLNMLEDARAHS